MRIAAIVRILTGVLFVAEGLSKISGPFVRGGFSAHVGGIAAGSFLFWKRFLEVVVVPRAGLFAWVVALGEIAVGTGLLAGFLTRVAAGGGALLTLTIALGQARPDPGASWGDWITSGLTAKFAFLLLILLFAVNPGTVWGFDARRRGRRAKLREVRT